MAAAGNRGFYRPAASGATAPRAYRDVVLGLGHVSQTILLLASARDLGATFASAVRDEHLGCDGISEIVLGVHALGHPAPEERPAPVTRKWLS